MGTIFSGMAVDRSKDGITRYQKVPVSFQEKEYFLNKSNSGESLNPTDSNDPTRKARIATVAPAMALQMVDMSYLSDKKTSVINRNLKLSTNGDPSYMLMNPVPYRFTFNLSIFTRNLSDQFALLEQILPFFQPSFTCKIQELKSNEITIDRDVLINLDDVSFSNDVQGSVTEKRYLQADLQFSLDGYLYPPTGEAGLIETVFVDFYANSRVLGEQSIDTLESVDWYGTTHTGQSTKVNNNSVSVSDVARK